MEPSVDFDYDAIDGAPIDSSDAAAESIRRIAEWMWQGRCADLNGLLCRAAVISWIFCPHLRELTMTEMAARCGRHKQSLGRWVDDLKLEFPELRGLSHFRHNTE